jgi:2-polyprenyl-6-methoxyphenol hydroxylase-like FAD-dependent oxidoreductase
MPNVTFHFGHKLTGADFRQNKAWFEVRENGNGAAAAAAAAKGQRAREIEVDFDFMIGADGAHSAVRYHMMKFTRMDYQQQYIDAIWCEFHIEPKTTAPDADFKSRFAISPNHLHIWPGKEFMFIALPNQVRTTHPFSLTLPRTSEAINPSHRMAPSHAPSSPRATCTSIWSPTPQAPWCLPSSTSTSPA